VRPKEAHRSQLEFSTRAQGKWHHDREVATFGLVMSNGWHNTPPWLPPYQRRGERGVTKAPAPVQY